ncbi:hypothetical protein [Aliikangiella sp. IMCC44359]|uniref:hypothetical protein n=1 Tax=Aliikangiella sp. IMCC44359 TaxID=3459125 RepID=UPI00403B3445
MNLRTLLTGFLFLIFSGPILADTTGAKKIAKIKIDGDDGFYYFVSTDGVWSAPGACANAQYVYIVPTQVLDKDAMLSVALAAKMSEKLVWFTGVCDVNGYFKATEIWIE